MMKKESNLNLLLVAIKNKKPLVMDLGDNVLLHMKWDEETITPDGIKGCYVDEMGMTKMELILDIARGEVKGFSLREDLENEYI